MEPTPEPDNTASAASSGGKSVFVRVLSGFAAIATLVQGIVVLLLSAHFLTVDGNTLRILAFVVAFVLAIGIPGGVALFSIRGLERRGFKPRRGALIAGFFALLNGLAATGLMYGVSSPVSSLWNGSQRLVWGGGEATGDADADAEPDADPDAQVDDAAADDTKKPDAKGDSKGKPAKAPVEPSGSNDDGASDAVKRARKSVQAVLAGDDPRAVPAALTEESAAALGIVWMRYLSEEYGSELELAAGAELWVRAHDGLPDQPDLWSDAAALKPVIVPRGRVFLGAVIEMADAVVVGKGTGPMTWPILPEDVVSKALRHVDGDATYEEAAMNRIAVTVGERTYDVRYEDHGWRLDLGSFETLCERAPSARTLAIALHP